MSCDAHHMTAPHPSGKGFARAMQQALKESGVKPSEVHYINAHGTGTEVNDVAETKAIKEVFGEQSYRIPVSSTKSLIGHTMGAASAIEAVVCLLALKNNVIPPTINYQEKDPDCDVNIITEKNNSSPVEKVMVNAIDTFSGFRSSSLIIGKYSQ